MSSKNDQTHLCNHLTDPQFRTLPGFPQATDEAILALSDPPFYTACPNPWLSACVQEWVTASENRPTYHREPFATDVREGKNDPIYNAHTYHTKVPHKAIMRYILHYTEPYDIVYDGFCGTGMTGVAAQLCGNREEVEKLGYRVLEDGTVLQSQEDENGILFWQPFSKLGPRRTVLNDLSPMASWIAYNYNTPVDLSLFQREAEQILQEVETECEWLYRTLHSCRKNFEEQVPEIEQVILGEASCPYWLTVGYINYMVWSEVFLCSECTGEIVFWEAALDKQGGQVRDTFECPHCQAQLTKRHLKRATITVFDKTLQETVSQVKQVPVLINYSVNTVRFEKTPDTFDLALLKKMADCDIPYSFPIIRMMAGDESRRNDSLGITHLHHFYTQRNLWLLSATWQKSSSRSQRHLLRMWVTSTMLRATKMYKFTADRKMGNLSGTFYIPSLSTENSVLKLLRRKLQDFLKIRFPTTRGVVISCASSETLPLPDNCIDYIFLDPPFGSNIMYSELNFLWEAWLQVFTNTQPEALINKTQGKRLPEYRQLMTQCFQEAYRLLKPGHWMTVEFSSTQASIWNTLQTALQEAGFVVANVSTLDKKQGSFKAVTTTTAVKQDLIISAYKPQHELEERFNQSAGTETDVWEFIRNHLSYLPICKGFKAGKLDFIAEREPRLLYDRLLTYFLQHGYAVPLSSQHFQTGLRQQFVERDGMIFLPEQVAEYESKRQFITQSPQMDLAVCDERSAIDWLRHTLHTRPATYQQLHPEFMKLLGTGWKKHEVWLELEELLELNFLKYEGTGEVPRQIHRYLLTQSNALRHLDLNDPILQAAAKERWYVPDPHQAQDLEKLREKQLLREFDSYRQVGSRRLKQFRLEALRAGFKKAWTAGEFALIIEIAEKIPDTVLQEDEKLLLWYTNALTRVQQPVYKPEVQSETL